MSKIPFFLVTGFLGSGKTTFLKRVLKLKTKLKIAIIQNEFAPANVDSIELKSENRDFSILEINNGSVFCVCLLSDFIRSLNSFIDQHHPEMILMEASGLSDPIGIAEILDNKLIKDKIFLAKIWTIVDCSRFVRQANLIRQLQHQVRIADTVIVNKTDLSNKSEIDTVTKEIKTLNPYAEISESSHCRIDDLSLEYTPFKPTIAYSLRDQNQKLKTSKRPDIEVGVIKSTRPINKERLEKFIEYHLKSTIRIKGFVKLSGNQFVAVQSSFDQFTLKEVNNYSGPTEIIFMGEGISFTNISKQFRELVEK